jgi:hypothetical protein
MEGGATMTSALITVAYRDARLFPAHNGYGASVAFYFGASAAETPALSYGTVFGVVYSPSVFSPTFAYWRYVRFEVRMCKFASSKAKERGYAETAKRALTSEEVAYFEAEWKRLTQNAATDAA